MTSTRYRGKLVDGILTWTVAKLTISRMQAFEAHATLRFAAQPLLQRRRKDDLRLLVLYA
jgi:hypothetical protein